MNYKSKLMGLSLILSAALSACSDEMESGLRPANSDYIAFTVNMPGSEGWTDGNNTRAAADSAASPINYAPIQMEGTLDGKPLYLHTEMSEGFPSENQPLTRGTQINKSEQISKFSVSAWYDTSEAFYMEDVEVKNDPKAGVWKPDGNWLWPNKNGMKFLAWSPFDLKIRSHPQLSNFSYATPSDVSKQVDLMIAYTGPLDSPTSGYTTPIALTFKHMFTAVKFVAGDDLPSCTVKSITLKNVKSRMILDGENYDHWWEHYSGGNGGGSGDGLSNTSNFTLDINKKVLGNPGDAITAEDQTFFMIPQNLPSQAEIEVVLTDDVDNTQHTLTAEIGGQEWQMGKTVVYKLSASSINWSSTFTVVPPSDFSYTGGSGSYRVTSYKKNAKGDVVPVPWTAEFSTDSGKTWTSEKPSWLTEFTSSGAGAIKEESFNLTVGAQSGVSSSLHIDALRNATPKGDVGSPYNLSNQSNGGASVENTANCYVVSAPGYYSFPLVYGNAIKNGNDNKSAYTSTASGKYILNTFINHAGAGIKDPYLVNNGCSPKTAELVWQDAENLVTDIHYNEGINGGNISFKVAKESINTGSAVIAIKDDNGKTLWSWHIWVTDENVNKMIAVTNADGEIYDMMPISLGWCGSFSIDYAKRSCLVKLRDQVGHERRFNVQQKANSITYVGSPKYFTWGRKDPLYSGVDKWNSNIKPYYNKEGVASTKIPYLPDKGKSQYVENTILYPESLIYYGGGDYLYYNLWNSNYQFYGTGNGYPAFKTIYDPSPVGFKVPDKKEISGFDERSNYGFSYGEYENCPGQYYFTNSQKKECYFFPFAGYLYHEYVSGYGRMSLIETWRRSYTNCIILSKATNTSCLVLAETSLGSGMVLVCTQDL